MNAKKRLDTLGRKIDKIKPREVTIRVAIIDKEKGTALYNGQVIPLAEWESMKEPGENTIIVLPDNGR